MGVLSERIAIMVHAFSGAEHKEAVRELARDVASLELAADNLAVSARLTLDPAKGNTGDERLYAAMSEYCLAVRKYDLEFNARKVGDQ